MFARNFLARLLLALSLLAFQQGALVHALEHVDETHGHSHATLHDCDLCHGYASAAHGFATAATHGAAPAAADAVPLCESVHAAAAISFAPDARAPPALPQA